MSHPLIESKRTPAHARRLRTRRVGIAFGGPLILGVSVLVAAFACSSSETSSARKSSGRADAGSASPTKGTGGSGALGPGPELELDGSSPADGENASDACAAQTQSAELVPVDMYIMLDKSGSMWQMTGGVTKWTAVKDALIGFFGDPQSAGLGVGMQYFPLSSEGPLLCEKNEDCAPQFRDCDFSCALQNERKCSSDADCLPLETNGPCMGRCSTAAVACTVPPYATDAVPIGSLPANAQALIDSINAQKPAHSTPSLYALSGAHERARAWANEHADHKVAVVFATDGTPSDCDDPSHSFDTIAGVARSAFEATPSVQTFVIGVFSENAALGAKPNLDRVAEAGGTTTAFIVDQSQDVKQQFLDALAEIRGGTLSCDLKLPSPPSGQSLDLTRVNVTLKTGDSSAFIGYVSNEAACADAGGWHYDRDPNAGAGPATKIVLCPKTCEMVKMLKQGELGIALECSTVVR